MTYEKECSYSWIRTCQSCKTDRPERDFIINDEFCFKCMYAQKTSSISEKNLKTKKVCKICGHEIKSSRSKYCSEECAKNAADEQNKNLWFRNIKCPKGTFKCNF